MPPPRYMTPPTGLGVHELVAWWDARCAARVPDALDYTGFCSLVPHFCSFASCPNLPSDIHSADALACTSDHHLRVRYAQRLYCLKRASSTQRQPRLNSCILKPAPPSLAP